jgi:hypothetical protein
MTDFITRKPRYLGPTDESLEGAIAELHQHRTLPAPITLPGAPAVENIGRVPPEAVQTQFENAAKSVEEMGIAAKERIAKLEAALRECDADMKLITETATAIREKGKLIYTQIEEVNIRSACADFKKKVAET